MKFGYDLLDKVCLIQRATRSHALTTSFIQGAIPDFILRRVIHALSEQRLREINHGSLEANHEAKVSPPNA